jgi:hypothetical protein
MIKIYTDENDDTIIEIECEKYTFIDESNNINITKDLKYEDCKKIILKPISID